VPWQGWDPPTPEIRRANREKIKEMAARYSSLALGVFVTPSAKHLLTISQTGIKCMAPKLEVT
jgi:hypothetical protein